MYIYLIYLYIYIKQFMQVLQFGVE